MEAFGLIREGVTIHIQRSDGLLFYLISNIKFNLNR